MIGVTPRGWPDDMLGMRLGVLTALVAVTAVGCSSPPPAEPATTQPTTSTTAAPAPTSTSSSAPRGPGLHDEWEPKFGALVGRGGEGICSTANAKSRACAAYLTDIVLVTLDLESAIQARPDKTRYADVLTEIDKVRQASEAYAPCSKGIGTPDHCQAEAIPILFAPVTIPLKLTTADLSR